MSDRRSALRTYLLEVVRDLVERGVVRQRAGQSLADVLRADLPVVLGAVHGDIAAVAKEIGVGLIGGIETIVRKNLDSIIGAGARALADRLSGTGRKR